MAVSKVVKSNGDVIMDISQDNVNPNNLLQGGTAHGSDGEAVQGAVIVAPTDVTEVSDTTPYLYKSSEHDAVYDELVGGSVAWNQLVQNGNFESTSGWGGVQATISAANNTLTLVAVGSQAFTGIQRGITQILANHVIIASYDYDASSISNFRRTLIQLRTGSVYTAYGSKTENKGTNSFLFKHTSTPDAIQIIFNKNTNFTSTDTITVKNFYCVDLTQMFGPTIADYVYNLEQSTAGSGIAWLKSYGFFTKDYYAYNAGGLASVNTSGKKVVSETTEITYPIQSTDLRGLYKLNGNKLYTDGDIYSADGTVTRKYGYRDYQSGDESLANAITDGTHTIYKLSAPTIETASSYTSPQMVYRNGTEEYLDSRDMPMPVGGNRKYVDIPEWMVNEYFDDCRTQLERAISDPETFCDSINALQTTGGTMTGDLIMNVGTTIKSNNGKNRLSVDNTQSYLYSTGIGSNTGLVDVWLSGNQPEILIRCEDSANNQYKYISLSLYSFRIKSNAIRWDGDNSALPTGTGTNLVIDSDGYFKKASSSRNVKHDISYVEDTNGYHDALMQLKPATFIYNSDETETQKLGMIAEDVADVCPIAGMTDKDGKVENYDDRAIIAMLVAEVQRLNAEIDKLKGR